MIRSFQLCPSQIISFQFSSVLLISVHFTSGLFISFQPRSVRFNIFQYSTVKLILKNVPLNQFSFHFSSAQKIFSSIDVQFISPSSHFNSVQFIKYSFQLREVSVHFSWANVHSSLIQIKTQVTVTPVKGIHSVQFELATLQMTTSSGG